MSIFSGFGLTKRLYGVSLLCALCLAALAFFSYVKLSDVHALAERTGTVRIPQLQRVASVELNVTRVSLQIRHAILGRTPQERDTALTDIGVKRKLIEDALSAYAKTILTPAGRAVYEKVPGQIKVFWEAGEANIKLIQEGKKDEAFAYLVDTTIPARNLLLAALADNVKYQEEAATEGLAAIGTNAFSTLTGLIVLSGFIVLLLMLSTWGIARTLRRRIELAEGVALRVSEGDLMTSVQDDASDEFSPLLKALGDMQASLVHVVGTVRVNAESVATASAEIAQGNSDLSARTEQQASALEQTAASMEELGSTVRHNADNAKQASQLALSASTVAVAGGDVVSQVVDTMKGINESSRKISDIIGVIDGIAFQTNILALNAAVEAARAGEQGRGFAVVAGEVRSLAQRSAEAAKEIKSLINASVERVGHGTLLVDKAGTTMSEVVGAIRRVTDIVGEISSASQEQSMGVQQVGQAVTQMDQATQQNAALVEQSAAAADSLRGQAITLVEAVSIFKLPGTHHAIAARPVSKPMGPAPVRRPAPLTSSAPKVGSKAAYRPQLSPAPARALASSPASASKPAAQGGGNDDWESF